MEPTCLAPFAANANAVVSGLHSFRRLRLPDVSHDSSSSQRSFDVYCAQKAAPPGSSVYYALRQAPLNRQPLLTALYALRRELEETVKHTSDPTIGRARLIWWEQELAALAAGQPSHPVTQALAAHGAD